MLVKVLKIAPEDVEVEETRKMLMTISGCGYNGFSQLDGFKCLNFDASGQIVSNNDCSITKTEQNSKVVLPEVLVQLNREFELDNILFTWSRIAFTLKKGAGYTSIITGFASKKALDKGDLHGTAVIVSEHSVAASTGTDILLSEIKNSLQYKILRENDTEFHQFSISPPNNTTEFQLIRGGHQDFFAVYDSITFGKFCQADSQAVKNSDAGNGMDKQLMHLNLHPIDSGIRIKEVSCGKEHALILSQSGAAYSYGLGSRGQLGHCSVEPESMPRLIAALDGVHMRNVCAGGWHSASISEFGDLYMWGWNESGQLGMPKDGNPSQSATAEECVGIQAEPRCVTLPDDLNVSTVACGSRHTALLTANSLQSGYATEIITCDCTIETARVFTSGWNAYGQLGLGDTENKDRFTEVVTIKGLCVHIFVGQWNSIFASVCK